MCLLLRIYLLLYPKHNTANLKDQLCLQLHERLTEKRAARSCEAGITALFNSVHSAATALLGLVWPVVYGDGCQQTKYKKKVLSLIILLQLYEYELYDHWIKCQNVV